MLRGSKLEYEERDLGKKPLSSEELTALFGGYDTARYVHFAAMATIVTFLVIHILVALLVPKSIRAMVRGR